MTNSYLWLRSVVILLALAGIDSYIFAQCPEDANVSTNGSCVVVTYTTNPPPIEDVPFTIQRGGLIFVRVSYSGGTAKYQLQGSRGNKCNGHTNVYTGTITSGGETCTYVAGTLESPLPVVLTAFSVRQTKEGIDLYWQTSTEQSNAGFEVQRSQNGLIWETLAWMPGAGETDGYTEYSFRDVHPLFGQNFYRLKQIDHDGAFEYSSIVAAAYEGEPRGLTVSPNPVGDLLNIIAPQASTVFINDPSGRLVMERYMASPTDQVDVSSLAQGLYMLSSRQPNGTVETVKFVKN